jgi:hypothetical protein
LRGDARRAAALFSTNRQATFQMKKKVFLVVCLQRRNRIHLFLNKKKQKDFYVWFYSTLRARRSVVTVRDGAYHAATQVERERSRGSVLKKSRILYFQA